jgi:hypothetical protein
MTRPACSYRDPFTRTRRTNESHPLNFDGEAIPHEIYPEERPIQGEGHSETRIQAETEAMKVIHSTATENRFPNKKILYSMRSFQKKDRSKAKASPRPGFKRRPKR